MRPTLTSFWLVFPMLHFNTSTHISLKFKAKLMVFSCKPWGSSSLSTFTTYLRMKQPRPWEPFTKPSLCDCPCSNPPDLLHIHFFSPFISPYILPWSGSKASHSSPYLSPSFITGFLSLVFNFSIHYSCCNESKFDSTRFYMPETSGNRPRSLTLWTISCKICLCT